MTVEIKELVVRAVVERQRSSDRPPVEPVPAETNKDEVVAECVKQVLRILEKSRER